MERSPCFGNSTARLPGTKPLPEELRAAHAIRNLPYLGYLMAGAEARPLLPNAAVPYPGSQPARPWGGSLPEAGGQISAKYPENSGRAKNGENSARLRRGYVHFCRRITPARAGPPGFFLVENTRRPSIGPVQPIGAAAVPSGDQQPLKSTGRHRKA